MRECDFRKFWKVLREPAGGHQGRAGVDAGPGAVPNQRAQVMPGFSPEASMTRAWRSHGQWC